MIYTEWSGIQKIKIFFKKLKRGLLFGAMVIPLTESGWEHLEFSDIPANQLKFSKGSLSVNVKNSASPLIYPIKDATEITGVEVKGTIERLIDLEDGETQGEKGADDYVLRVGFVLPGDKDLNWAQKMVAPAWVKKLHSLAPKNSGIDHIYFFNLGQQSEQRGRERIHPLSDLIKEKVEWVMDKPGDFDLSAKFEDPKQVSAIWISIDGDDTNSEYTTKIKSLKLLKASDKKSKSDKQTSATKRNDSAEL